MNNISEDDGYISLDISLEPCDNYMELTGLGPFRTAEDRYAQQVLRALQVFGRISFEIGGAEHEWLTWMFIQITRIHPDHFNNLAEQYRQRIWDLTWRNHSVDEDFEMDFNESEEEESNMFNNSGRQTDHNHLQYPTFIMMFPPRIQEPLFKTWRAAFEGNDTTAWNEVITACLDMAYYDPYWDYGDERTIGSCRVRREAPDLDMPNDAINHDLFRGLGFQCGFFTHERIDFPQNQLCRDAEQHAAEEQTAGEHAAGEHASDASNN